MLMARPCRIALAALAALVLAQGAARADAPLRWKFTKGKAIHYVLTQKAVSKTQAQGQLLETTMTQTMDMTWAFTGVNPDGSARMEQTLDRIQFTMESPFGKVAVDTKDDKEAEGPAGAVAKVLRG